MACTGTTTSFNARCIYATNSGLCFIADTVHVPAVALANYLALAGDRAVVVTDAIAPAGLWAGAQV